MKPNVLLSKDSIKTKRNIMTKQRIQVLGQGLATIWGTVVITLSLVDKFVAPLPGVVIDFVYISLLLLATEYTLRNLLKK